MSQATLFEVEPARTSPMVEHLAGQLGWITARDRKLSAAQRAELERIAADAIDQARRVTA